MERAETSVENTRLNVEFTEQLHKPLMRKKLEHRIQPSFAAFVCYFLIRNRNSLLGFSISRAHW